MTIIIDSNPLYSIISMHFLVSMCLCVQSQATFKYLDAYKLQLMIIFALYILFVDNANKRHTNISIFIFVQTHTHTNG